MYSTLNVHSARYKAHNHKTRSFTSNSVFSGFHWQNIIFFFKQFSTPSISNIIRHSFVHSTADTLPWTVCMDKNVQFETILRIIDTWKTSPSWRFLFRRICFDHVHRIARKCERTVHSFCLSHLNRKIKNFPYHPETGMFCTEENSIESNFYALHEMNRK